MLIGQSIIGQNGVNVEYFTPWIPRQSDKLTYVVETIKVSAGFSLTCDVQTKNNEDSDSGVGIIGTAGITTIATTPIVATGALELVRVRLRLKGTASDVWLHLRSNPPIWQPN